MARRFFLTLCLFRYRVLFFIIRVEKMLTKKTVTKKDIDFSKLLTLENAIAFSYFMYKTLSTVKKLSEGAEVTDLIEDKEVIE